MEKQELEFMLTNLINALVKDEWDAVEGYNGAIATLTDQAGMENVISVLTDIRDEEYVHIGQLESCLSLLKGDPVKQIEDGNDEGFEQLELPETDEVEDVKIESATIGESKKSDVDDLDIEEVKRRLLAVGFDRASFMGKSDKEIRAMLKINRRARGDDYLRKWNKERREKEKSTKSEALLKEREDAEIDLNFDMPMSFSDPDDLIHSCKMGGLHRYDIIGELCDYFGVSEVTAESWIDDYENDTLIDASRVDFTDEKRPGLSEHEMKKIICDMVDKYEASEEEVFDELQSQDPSITRDVAHRLFKMCNKSSVPECVEESFDFDTAWEDLNDMED